jgi:hypothetical protein
MTPEFGVVGITDELVYDPLGNNYVGPRHYIQAPVPIWWEIRFEVAFWWVWYWDGTMWRVSAAAFPYVPFIVFPGKPIGTEDQWDNGSPYGTGGVGADENGYCLPAGNVAGFSSQEMIQWPWNIELWSVQFTYFDPGNLLYPGSHTWRDVGPDTWQSPHGVKVARLEMVGSGAGGGEVSQNGITGGGGGGSGAWQIWDHIPIAFKSYDLNVGEGGAGGNGWNALGKGADGDSGGITTFDGRSFVAITGQGGAGALQLADVSRGGNGAIVTPAFWSTWWKNGKAGSFGSTAAIGALGGAGGNSHYAAGGAGGNPGGQVGASPGAGGAGSFDTTRPGGNGAPGFVRLIWGFGVVVPGFHGAGGFWPEGFFPDGFLPDGFLP